MPDTRTEINEVLAFPTVVAIPKSLRILDIDTRAGAGGLVVIHRSTGNVVAIICEHRLRALPASTIMEINRTSKHCSVYMKRSGDGEKKREKEREVGSRI